MRPFKSTIPLDEARRRLDAAVTPVGRIEHVALADAAGRVSAANVTSRIDVPPFDRAAMDGYAVRALDTARAGRASPIRLEIVERIYTGAMPARAVGTGQCAEIATGAPLPAGADAVIMVEETSSAGDHHVDLLAAAIQGQNVSLRAADIATGDPVAGTGDWLNAARIGALAAVGIDTIDVYAKPRVAILSTGNEVVDPGKPLAPGQIYDVNRFTLSAVVSANGGIADCQRPAHDTHEALDAALDACRGADLIVFSGGSSVGERDLVSDLVARRGEMIFHGVAIKPGKPTALARVDGVPFFGMPGNPTSCLSNAHVLLIPFLRATARLPPLLPQIRRAPLARSIPGGAGRHQFYTVRIADGKAWPAFKGSGAITSLSHADGYIEIPADAPSIEAGTPVDVVLF